MREARLIETRDLQPDEVLVEQRLRPAGEAAVAAIMASIEQLGIVKDEIIVRRVAHRKNALVLIAGAHRLEACRRLGRAVPAKIFDCGDDWARLMELDDNLAGGDLTVLDTAIFLAARKRVYEKMHPEAKAKTGAALVARRWNTADQKSVVSFADATAEKFGITAHQVRKIIAAGEAIGPKEAGQLRGSPRPVTLADLQAIAKIGNAVQRYFVCDQMATGKKAAEALTQWAVQEGLKPAPKSKVELGLDHLMASWDRASKETRRRFAARFADELAELLDDLRDGGDEA